MRNKRRRGDYAAATSGPPTPVRRFSTIRASGSAPGRVNSKIYIHEFIDVIGHNRARYMHHMTANWCPTARAERNMLCFGVWGTVGSTGRWPEVVNLWELDGWDGLVASFGHELASPSLQDPALAEWWGRAAELRRGGVDRIVVPEQWSPTIEELTAAGVKGAVYAHELVTVPEDGRLETGTGSVTHPMPTSESTRIHRLCVASWLPAVSTAA